MSCRCAPALIVARNELNAVWPNRDRGSDGCCGDAAHRARKSDHNPRTTGPGKGFAAAYDYDEDIATDLGDRELTGVGLVLLGDPRTKYLIYEAQLLYPDGTVRAYTGVNAHRSHLHHSIHDWAIHDTRPWGIARAFQPQEDDLTPDQAQQLNRVETALGVLLDQTHKIKAETDKLYSGATISAIADAVVKILPPANGGAGLTAEQVADELAERLES